MTAPDPMTPPECDLRDYPWMPLDVRRLLTSETWMVGPAEGKVAALSLWCEAWCQVPAGSLPNNDTILEHLSQARRAWPKVRDHALRGWVLCSDGRLYHPVVAEKVKESWERKISQKDRTAAARKARAAKRDGHSTDTSSTPVTLTVTSSVTEIVTEDQGNRESAVSGDSFGHSQELDRNEKVIHKQQCRNDLTQPVVIKHPAFSVTEDVTGSNRTEQNRPIERKKGRPPVRPPTADASAEPPPTRTEARGIRLPVDWQPSPADAAFAADFGLDVAASAAEFRDYWHGVPGAKGRKLDWPATWRNRCRERAARLGQRSGRRETLSEERRRKLGITSRFDELDTPVILDTEAAHVRFN